MLPEIKFCGMTREADVDAAVGLGARYVGVILAGGPRSLTIARARELLRRVPTGVGRVGVFGRVADSSPWREAQELGLDVLQLHGDPDEATVELARSQFDGVIWAALRVAGDTLPAHADALFRAADAVVLDAHSSASLGGSGRTLPWDALAPALERVRQPGRLVLAGGLRAENVALAVRALGPDVVDVSSGVESAPGIKDHGQLRAFRDAVRNSEAMRDERS